MMNMDLVVLVGFLLLWNPVYGEHKLDIRACHYLSHRQQSEFECICNIRHETNDIHERIPRTWVCDAWTDCSNGADERDCICPTGQFQCNDCQYNESTCYPLFLCISNNKVCDGQYDCTNNRDEDAEYCTVNKHKQKDFRCDNGLHILTTLRCDGNDDCLDGSDEHGCDYFTYKCDSNKLANSVCKLGECFSQKDMCDGKPDCLDHSDEKNCSACPIGMPIPCACNDMENYTCTGSEHVCHDAKDRCTTTGMCSDHSDEWNCLTCPAALPLRCSCNQVVKYTCTGDGVVCYNEKNRCDALSWCPDSSDELNCFCPDNLFTCDCFQKNYPTCNMTKGCISEELVYDGNLDCDSGNDEEYVLALQRMHCSTCVVNIIRLESEHFCHSPWCDKTTCFTVPALKCSSYQCNIKNTICTSSCTEYNTTNDCNTVMQCSDQTAILNFDFCNGRPDCVDNSDEITNRPGFKCSAKSSPITCVLPQWNLYDNVAQCYDRSDLCFSEDGTLLCFQCLDKRLIISSLQVCDGIIDCYDMSDECLCEKTTLPICLDILSYADSATLQCNRSNESCAYKALPSMHDVVCDGIAQCTNAIDEINCSKDVATIKCEGKWGEHQAIPCDGRPECKDFKDECDSSCKNPPIFCNDSCHSFYPLGDRYCDGYIDEAWTHLNNTICSSGFDELNCPMRFNCKAGKKVSIDVLQQCNGIVDCDDGSDEKEKDCTDRFYCDAKAGGLISISMKLYLDGKQDCFDGSDEFKSGLFSSPHEMIANLGLLAWFWIVAIITFIGNIYVFFMSLEKLVESKMANSVRCNHLLAINLSACDFLMGIYLSIIVVKAHSYSGNYSMHDREWRTSVTCALAGSLCVLSSQTSSFIMCIISAHRLYIFWFPFKARSSTVTPWMIAIIITWIVVLVLAMISNLFDYFKLAVLFGHRFSGSDIASDDYVISFACRIASLTGVKFKSSGNLGKAAEDYLHKEFPLYSPQGDIGYYGTTSMCIPRFYVTTSDSYWIFSISIITIDFVLFSYVFMSHVFIGNKMTHSHILNQRVHRDTRRLYNRITRLIVTDFCCWIPICIMAYLNIAGVIMPPEADMFTAGVLLPINSALNPLLYSQHIEDKWHQLVSRLRGKNETAPPQVEQQVG